jgi:hypothetical protein
MTGCLLVLTILREESQYLRLQQLKLATYERTTEDEHTRLDKIAPLAFTLKTGSKFTHKS